MPVKDPELRKQLERERYARIKQDPERFAKRQEQTKLWKEQNKEQHRESIKSNKLNKKNHLIEMLGGKCVGCGITEDLQFDHIDRKNKSFTIGKCLGYSLERLIPEAQKCQLLCKSCHQIKTTIGHDVCSLRDGYAVREVIEKDDEIVVILKKQI